MTRWQFRTDASRTGPRRTYRELVADGQAQLEQERRDGQPPLFPGQPPRRPPADAARRREQLAPGWARVLALLEQTTPTAVYAIWLADLVAVDAVGDRLWIQAPPERLAAIDDRFHHTIEHAANQRTTRPVTVHLLPGPPPPPRPPAPREPSSLLQRLHLEHRTRTVPPTGEHGDEGAPGSARRLGPEAPGSTLSTTEEAT